MNLVVCGVIKNLNLALTDNDNKIIGSKTILLNKNLATILANEAKTFLEENNSSFKEIESLFVVNGPGSFTSVKLVVIFANILKMNQEINLFQIDTLSWFRNSESEIVTLEDGKKRIYYQKPNSETIYNISLKHFEKSILAKFQTIINRIEDTEERFEQNIKRNLISFKKVNKVRFNFKKKPV